MASPILNEYIGKHSGQKCWVYGIGPSCHQDPLDDVTIIGVNDVENYGIKPDYLVCIDQLNSFHNEPERKSCIQNSNAPIMFTQCDQRNMPLVNTKRVKIDLSSRRGDCRMNPNNIDISFTSVVVAFQVAFHLGFDEITIAGCDIHHGSTHHLAKRTNEIKRHFNAIHAEMLKIRDIKVYNAGNPTGVLSDFESTCGIIKNGFQNF